MLKGSVVKIQDLKNDNIVKMYDLMCGYYENIRKENFISDLLKKYQAILLKDESDNIKGFTTVVLYDIRIDKVPIKLLFSGDTIIDKDFWSNNDLMQVWIKNVMELKKEFSEKLYWLLISKGYKTYKYLSALYNEFYPRYDTITPIFYQKIIDKFGEVFYPNNYDKKSGLIIMNKKKDYLKEEYAKIPDEKLKDKNIKFFVEKNPNYYKGDELVCVAELSLENLNKIGRKILES